MPKSGSDQVQVDVKFREEDGQKQIEKAGEPGSGFVKLLVYAAACLRSPAIMKSHITDMLNQLHTSEMEELLGEQIELLRAAGASMQDRGSADHHEGVKSMVEGFE
eukprot:s523_g32.t1